MNDVSCRCVKAMVEMATHAGVSKSLILKDITIPEEELFHPNRRIDWSLYVLMLRRCTQAVGGFEGVRKMGRYYCDTTANRFVGSLARQFITPRAFYWFISQWVGPMSFSNQTATSEYLPNGCLRITLTLHPGFEPSPEYFWFSAGALEVLPRYIGLRDAIVDAQVEPRSGQFTITMPPAGTVGSRLGWLFKALFTPRAAVEELRNQHDHICAQYETTDRMSREYRELLERNTNGIVVYRDNRMLYANPAYSRALGYDLVGDLMHLPLRDLVFPPDLSEWHKLVASDAGSNHEVEVRMLGRDERIVIMALTQIKPVRFGQQDAAMILARDVTEQRALEHAIEQTRNREQERLARDLHDGLGQQLVAVVRRAEGLKATVSDPGVDEVITLAMQAVRDAQAIGRGLDPLALTATGLPGLLRELAQRTTADFGVTCQYQGEAVEPYDIDKATATHLYRIAQEAVANALKHASPGNITLSLVKHGAVVTMTIGDDGSGIRKRGVSTGTGLRNMQYRAQQIGGVLTLQARATGGTDVQCSVTLAERAEIAGNMA